MCKSPLRRPSGTLKIGPTPTCEIYVSLEPEGPLARKHEVVWSSFSDCSGISDLRIDPRILLDLEEYVGETSEVIGAHHWGVGCSEDDADHGLF